MDDFISGHLLGVSRTYALVIPLLPAKLDDAVGLAYLLMRIVDTLEDDPALADAERRSLLRTLDEILTSAERPPPATLTARRGALPAEQSLMADTPLVLARIRDLAPGFRSPACACARKMIAGVLSLLERGAARGEAYPAVRNADELREYCYYVAGVVGEMLCEMFAHHLNRPSLLGMRDVAVALGTGLQLVNILKDARRDSRDGRRYLPQTARPDEDGAIYAAALHEARRCLTQGVEYVLTLPAESPGLRAFCGLPLVWGAMTLALAERDGAGAKIGRDAIHGSIERFQQIAGDDRALREWFQALLPENPRCVVAR